MANVIMIQGTMSNAGKSILTAGLCRILKQEGFKVAPFKSQNMALNSFITEEGLEMGRAQVVQAEAAGIKPVADMNPVLLKPTTDVGSQVIVHGVSIGNMKAVDYFAFKKSLVPEILTSYHRLEENYDTIVVEGAGSPAEINLKQEDIVNMGLAELLDAPVLLVGDIDRGGVFAQLYGTVMLLEPKERQRIKGLVINKFRGDKAILMPGVRMIEELCGIPVVGIVPYMEVDIEEEDSLGDSLHGQAKPGLVDIVVIRVPRISNFTDFQVFDSIPYVSLRYVDSVSDLGMPDMVILPGSKSSIEDLLWMRQCGLEGAVLKLAARDVPIFGICGGYQMLGETLLDEKGVEQENGGRKICGMGLLPVDTVYEAVKTTTRIKGFFGELQGIMEPLSGMELDGYEIHMGTTCGKNMIPTVEIEEYQAGMSRKKSDGTQNGNIYGTYMHGIFDAPGVALVLAGELLKKKGFHPEHIDTIDHSRYKELQYNKLADCLRESLDMEAILGILMQGRDKEYVK